jgi:hypothetical protein
MPRKGEKKKLSSTLQKNKAILIFATKEHVRQTVRQEMKTKKKTCICCKSCNLFRSTSSITPSMKNIWSKEN